MAIHREDWEIGPVRVAVCCFGSEFDNGGSLSINHQEDLRVDFGVDTLFLPDPSLTGSGRLVESNVKSLLKLVHDIEDELPLERRALETESGENFADEAGAPDGRRCPPPVAQLLVVPRLPNVVKNRRSHTAWR